MSRALDRFQSHSDPIAHSGVQPWSQGALFPGVIARIETYVPVLSFEEHGNLLGGWWHHPVVLQERYNAYLRALPLGHRLVRTEWEATYKAETRVFESYEEAATWLATLKEFDEEGPAIERAEREHAEYLAARERSIAEGSAPAPYGPSDGIYHDVLGVS